MEIPNLAAFDGLNDVVSGASILIIQTASPEFENIASYSNGLLAGPSLIFDFWGNINRPDKNNGDQTIACFGDSH